MASVSAKNIKVKVTKKYFFFLNVQICILFNKLIICILKTVSSFLQNWFNLSPKKAINTYFTKNCLRGLWNGLFKGFLKGGIFGDIAATAKASIIKSLGPLMSFERIC